MINLRLDLLFDEQDQVFDPEKLPKTDIDFGVAPSAKRSGQPPRRGLDYRYTDRHFNSEEQVLFPVERAVQQTAIMAESARVAVSRLFEEIGEFNLQVGRFRLQAILHLLQDNRKTVNIYLAVEFIENFHKAAHMGSLEPVGQIDVHVGGGDGVLLPPGLITHGNRIGDGFHPDLLNINPPAVTLALDIFHSWSVPPAGGRRPASTTFIGCCCGRFIYSGRSVS